MNGTVEHYEVERHEEKEQKSRDETEGKLCYIYMMKEWRLHENE